MVWLSVFFLLIGCNGQQQTQHDTYSLPSFSDQMTTIVGSFFQGNATSSEATSWRRSDFVFGHRGSYYRFATRYKIFGGLGFTREQGKVYACARYDYQLTFLQAVILVKNIFEHHQSSHEAYQDVEENYYFYFAQAAFFPFGGLNYSAEKARYYQQARKRLHKNHAQAQTLANNPQLLTLLLNNQG